MAVAVCLSNAVVEEPLVGLITGGQGRACNGQFGMQGVMFQTRCWKDSAHPLSCAVASTRRGTGKDLAPDVGTKAGIPEDTMWRLLRMYGLAKAEGRAKQALKMAGRQAEA